MKSTKNQIDPQEKRACESVNELISSKSFYELSENSLYFLGWARSKPYMIPLLCKMLSAGIEENLRKYSSKMIKGKDVVVLSDNAAVTYILSLYIRNNENPTHIIAEMKSLFDDFLAMSEKSKEQTINKNVSEDNIRYIIRLADYKFGDLNVSSPKNPLVILKTNDSIINHESLLCVEKFQKPIIFMANPIYENYDSVFLLVRCLGNLFNKKITGNFDIIHPKFVYVLEQIGFPKILTSDDKRNVFADLFAMALLNNSEFEEHNPYVKMNAHMPLITNFIRTINAKRE